MRIAYVNSMRSIGGGERWLLEVIEGMGARGHRSALACRAGSELARVAAARGIDVAEFPMRGDADPSSLLGLASWIRATEASLVSVNVQRAVRLGAAAARIAGVRPVVERRGLLFPLKCSSLNRFVYSRLVSRVVANCEAIRASVVESGVIDADRVTVVRNGIDAGRVRKGGGPTLRRDLGIEPDAPVVAVLGRLAPDKGHHIAIEAFADYAASRPSARLVIAGGGKLMSALKDKASKVASPGSVIFMGHVDDVGSVLDASDVVLVSSFREGMPHVVLEAMAAGTPVVATSVAGIPEMIEDGRSGVLIPPGSTAAASEALRGLLADRKESKRLAEAARERVLREFGLEKMLDEVEDCFAREIETDGGSDGHRS